MKKLIFAIILLFSSVCHAKLDVVFAIDNNYPLYTMLVINSIIKNNKSGQEYTFWVLETGITDENKTKMKDYAESIKQEINFITVDTKYIEKWSKLYDDYVTPIAMSRILIPDLLPQNIEKALYLDSDILVAEDLKGLFEEDLGDYYAAMVQDKMSEKEKYMNAGVILFNLPRWRVDGLSEKMVDFIDSHKRELKCSEKSFWEKSDCYKFKDQDVIHFFLKDNTKELDRKWNNQVFKNQTVTVKTQKGIYHFIGGLHRKPWNSQRNDPQKLYKRYWEESPFASQMNYQL